ncbi:putative photosystem I [Medicago truncatula]|uniref:Putative photosystem I n=1 Tax=Medicago truncatula TaxID=3880 RepID=Q2HTB6_MEDTR|nr:protein CURVATURE THYLAKOID 1B, chloroplastic [Medicago truncatula]ABD32715.1 thylakoid membrane phosphoprotein 14 kda, chloroplast precursor, putative [Medicago truncatula]ACJ86163.1 unknown [Medicago truncatula]AES82830.1 thylakoid membrane phosphoprotein 14 kDa protein [Medicago truncatula]AFK37916.1 unknown [Medicago truncatula]RHN49612.1 putative photosystem I [Medicago truncatula]
MASSASSSTFSSFTLVDGKPPCRHSAASPQCVSLPPLQSHTRPWKTTAFCRKIARNVISMASSTTTETEADAATTEVASTDPSTVTDSPELVKTIQQTWDKVEDKYAVSALAVAGTVALWGSAGVISAIDRLPLIPGVLELVGIGYTGWFAYKNLVFKPEREALIRKIKGTVKDITGIDT